MNQASWERLADAVDIKFGISRHGQLERPLEDRPDLTEAVNFIEFDRDGKPYRLERVTRPAIAEKKSFYHKAATGGVRFENIYDTENLVSKVDFFVREGDDWQPIDTADLAI